MDAYISDGVDAITAKFLRPDKATGVAQVFNIFGHFFRNLFGFTSMKKNHAKEIFFTKTRIASRPPVKNDILYYYLNCC